MVSKSTNISPWVYYTKFNDNPLKAYWNDESNDFTIFFFEKKNKQHFNISVNETLTLTSKKKGFKRLLVIVKNFEPTPYNGIMLGILEPESVEEIPMKQKK